MDKYDPSDVVVRILRKSELERLVRAAMALGHEAALEDPTSDLEASLARNNPSLNGLKQELADAIAPSRVERENAELSKRAREIASKHPLPSRENVSSSFSKKRLESLARLLLSDSEKMSKAAHAELEFLRDETTKLLLAHEEHLSSLPKRVC